MRLLLNKTNTIFLLISFCILSSPGISYSVLYPYHLLLPIIVFILLGNFINKNYVANKFTFYLSLFFIYCCFSIFFLNTYTLFLNYIVYVFISCSCMVYVYSYMNKDKNYYYLSRVFSLYLFLILLIALCESLSIFRMPFSPYSQYYSFFGKTLDVSDWSDDVFLYNTQKPTVFAGNPNTFGFILICYLPFLFLFKNKILKYILLAISLFVIYKIDSKMILLTFVLFLILKFLIFSKKRIVTLVLSIMALFFLYPIIVFLQNSGVLEGRMFMVIDELTRGIDYIFGNSSDGQMDSTGERAYIYSLGIQKFSETYGIGMGLSGIESYLSNFFGKHTAFHNFFLMMLVDLGIIGFLSIVIFYFYIIKNLILGVMKFRGTQLGDIYEAFLVGVILSVVSSITPSGIIYLLPYWFFMGAAAFMAFNWNKLGK